jgi:hypothetical protein
MEALAGFILSVGNQRSTAPALSALEPAERALRFIDQHRASDAVHLLERHRPQLMLFAERIALSF